MKLRTGAFARLRSGRGLSSAFAIAAAIRDSLTQKAFFILAVAFSGATLYAQQSAWVESFDKIRDPDTLQKLHAYQKQGWEPIFRATGKSADALTDEAEFEIQQLQNMIASDNDAIQRAKISSAIATTPAQCKAALINLSNPLFAVCDKSLRQDQLLAVSGILKLLPAYQGSLPKPEAEGQYGKNLSSEVVATLKIRVLSPEPSTARTPATQATGSSALITSFADDGRTLEVQRGANVVIQLEAKGKRASGFVVDPVGILALKPGVVHFDTERMMVLQAAKPGLVTITFHGPLIAPDIAVWNTSWSGYVKPGGPFLGIKGQWQVPYISTPYSPYGASSTWIGLDGSDGKLIQIGTSQYYNAPTLGIGGGVSYYPWWQVLPQNGSENSISKSAHPGDWMLATIAPAPGQSPPAPNQKSTWEMTLTNITQGWTFSTKQSYNGPLNSADWILEDPQLCFLGCSNQTLVNYGQVFFDYGDAVATSLGNANAPNWVSPALTADEEWAINQNNSIYSIPGPPSCDGDGFLVSYSTNGQQAWGQNDSPGPIVNTALLRPAQEDAPYSQMLSASDAWASPFPENWSWSLTGSGYMPPGMTLSSSGIISGNAQASGPYTFGVVATDNSTYAHASSCPQNLSINVSLTALSILQIACGGVSPSTPATTLGVEVGGAPAACGNLTLSPGSHTVAGTVEQGVAGTDYKITYSGACIQNGISSPANNPPAVVNLAAGQAQACEIGAVSWEQIETRGCAANQKCCEAGLNGCKICWASGKSCP